MRMSLDFGNKTKWPGRLWFYMVVALMVSSIVFVWANVTIRPFIIGVAKGYATNAVNNTLTGIIDELLKEESYEFVNIISDSEGKIAAVTMNSADTNLFMTGLTMRLKNKIADMEEIEAKIPLGNFLPYPFLAGLGPDIKVRFLILANSDVKLYERFEAQGINQTLYTVTLHADTKVGIYIPTMHSAVVIENELPLYQTLIVGGVPDSYTNVEGMEGTVQDTVLDIE